MIFSTSTVSFKDTDHQSFRCLVSRHDISSEHVSVCGRTGDQSAEGKSSRQGTLSIRHFGHLCSTLIGIGRWSQWAENGWSFTADRDVFA